MLDRDDGGGAFLCVDFFLIRKENQLFGFANDLNI